jgi:membrane-associated protease RseP (regulator of RpoE activity)
MRVRRLVLVLMAVFMLSGAMLSAVSAAPRGQDAGERSRPERPAKAFLGLETTKLSPRVKQYLQVPEETTGLLVMGTLPGSPAEAAGLQRPDIILSVSGTAIESPRDLSRLVQASAPGDVIDVSYLREGVTSSVSITLADLANHKSPAQPKWLATLRNFMRAFPNVVVGNIDVLGDDAVVHQHTITPVQVVSTDESSVTVIDRLGATLVFTVESGTAIVRGDYRIEHASLREGTHVVVLEIDGTLKAIVVTGAPRADAGSVAGADIDAMQANPRGPIVSTFRSFMNDLKDQFKVERDRGSVLELIQKLQERLAELQARSDAAGDNDNNSGDVAA